MTPADLIVSKSGKVLLKVRLDRGELSIGGGLGTDVHLPDDGLPEVAALLFNLGKDHLRLRILSHEITVNGQASAAEDANLRPGDRFGIGSYELQIREWKGDADFRHSYRKTDVLTPDHAPDDAPAAVLQHHGNTIRLNPLTPFSIGANHDNDLILEEDFVSSFHCSVGFQAGRWMISDLGSTNGTVVNGLRVTEGELPARAEIQLGNGSVTFERSEPAPGTAPAPAEHPSFHGMFSTNKKMRTVFRMVEKYADANNAVLIVGESGTGKELVARALHDQSQRHEGRFLAINCST